MKYLRAESLCGVGFWKREMGSFVYVWIAVMVWCRVCDIRIEYKEY